MIALVLQADYDRLSRDDRFDLHSPDNRYEPDMDFFARLIGEGIYKPVALLNVERVEEAFRYTNSVEDHWSNEARDAGKLMSLPNGDRHRSTSIGDIIVADGVAQIVIAIGYRPLPKAQSDELAKTYSIESLTAGAL
jgi:hypothetical protein